MVFAEVELTCLLAAALVLDTSHKSISALTKRSAVQTITLKSDCTVAASSPLSFSAADVQHTSYSPDGQLQAVFRSIAAKEGKESRKIVEIYGVHDGALRDELEVTTSHGDWYFDGKPCHRKYLKESHLADLDLITGTFGPAAWHPDCHSLLYVAEAPKPKSKATLPKEATYKYTPDYGETFTGRRSPCIFLFLLSSSPFSKAVESGDKPSVHHLTTQEDFPDIDFGQPVFLPDDASSGPRLLATGYSRCARSLL